MGHWRTIVPLTRPPRRGAIESLAPRTPASLSPCPARLIATGEARIAVYNPFRFDLALRGLKYELSSGGSVVARGSRQGVLVRPGRENEIVLPLTVGNAAAISAAGKAVAAGGKLTGELKGELVLKLGTGDVKLPLAGSGTIEVLR